MHAADDDPIDARVLRQGRGSVPTGFAMDSLNWISATLSLTTGEEGQITVIGGTDHGFLLVVRHSSLLLFHTRHGR